MVEACGCLYIGFSGKKTYQAGKDASLFQLLLHSLSFEKGSLQKICRPQNLAYLKPQTGHCRLNEWVCIKQPACMRGGRKRLLGRKRVFGFHYYKRWYDEEYFPPS